MIQLIHLDCLMFKFWFIRETWNQIVDLSVWPDIVSCLLIVDYFLFADFTPYHVSFYRYALPYLQIYIGASIISALWFLLFAVQRE